MIATDGNSTTSETQNVENPADQGDVALSFEPPPQRQARIAMVCVLFAMFLSALSQTVVATTMPLIIADLGGFDRYTWAATSYLVTATIAFPIVGSLSDTYGRKLFLVIGLAIFCLGSTLIYFSESMNQVVLYRAIQGIGGGTLMTCCYVAVADLFRPEERGNFHGTLSAVYGASFVVGPILGGALADVLSWQMAFLIIGFAAIPALALVTWVYPKHKKSNDVAKFDFPGAITLILALPPLLIALSSGGVQYEWSSPYIVGMLLFAGAMIAIFIAIEKRSNSPLVPLAVYTDGVVCTALLIMALISFAMYAIVLFLPLLFQMIYGYSATESGALLIPLLLGMVIGGVVAGRTLSVTNDHYRIQALVCCTLTVIGLGLMITVEQSSSIFWSQTYIVIAGLGLGGIIATLTVGVQNHVDFGIVGAATSALQFFRSIGGAFGLAITGALLAMVYLRTFSQAVPESLHTVLGSDNLRALQDDPRALSDSNLISQLNLRISESSQNEKAVIQEITELVEQSLLTALDAVFITSAIIVALAIGLTYSFRVASHGGSSSND